MPTPHKPGGERPEKAARDALRLRLRAHGYTAIEAREMVAAGMSRADIVAAVIEAQRQARPA